MNSEIWEVLDLAPVRDRHAIRRAYARRLKVTSPEDDAEAFQALRSAYEEALASLDWDWAWDDDSFDVEADSAIDGDHASINPHQLQVVIDGPIDPRAPPPDDDSEHSRQLQALEALVLAEPRTEIAELETALAAIMASPAMASLTVAAQTEQWIASLIAHNAPRSDVLVRPAINAFRWGRERVRTRHDGLREAVLDRDANIIFRNGVLRSEGPQRIVFLALTRPIGQALRWRERFWPDFEPAMRALLTEIDERRPSLRADLNAETLRAWEERLRRPHLPSLAFWIAAVASLLPALYGLIISPLTALGVYLAGVAACLATSAIWIFGIAPLRRLWRDRWNWRAPSWVRFGWSPAGVSLLLMAALAPVNAWTTTGVGLCAAALVLWAIVTCEIEADPAPGAWPLPLKLLVGQGLLVAWWGVLMLVTPEATPPAATLAFVGAAIASAAGASTLPILWYRGTTRPLRFGLILGLAAATLWTALQLLNPSDETGGLPMAAAATAAIVLAHRPLAAGLGPTALQWRYRIQASSLLAVVGGAPELGWLKVSGLWFLAGVVVALIGAVALEKDL